LQIILSFTLFWDLSIDFEFSFRHNFTKPKDELLKSYFQCLKQQQRLLYFNVKCTIWLKGYQNGEVSTLNVEIWNTLAT